MVLLCWLSALRGQELLLTASAAELLKRNAAGSPQNGPKKKFADFDRSSCDLPLGI